MPRITYERLPQFPSFPDNVSKVEDGYYTVAEAGEKIVVGDGPNVKSEIWFATPALDVKAIKRIESVQLFAQCHDQGYADVPEQGNWTWFDLVILEHPNASVPRVKDGIELVWRSHLNRFLQDKYDWSTGNLFKDSHEMFGLLEDGNSIGVRLCSRFSGWELYAKDGFLLVELVQEVEPRETIDYKPIIEKVNIIQDALQTTNAFFQTGFVPQPIPALDVANTFRDGRPLRVLTLDGGGIRGLSSLLILREIFKDIPKKPHEIFDMIAGTSTGGLIAIMLGRLKMSVDEALGAYKECVEKIFSDSIIAKGIRFAEKGYQYNAENLEKAVKKVVKDKTGSEDTMLFEDGATCRVFVMATMRQAGDNHAPVFLRSYTNPHKISDLAQCEIWKAARATSAAPGYFASINVNGIELVDGGLQANNPVGWLWNELSSIYGVKRPTSCFLSIGTGIPKNTALRDLSAVNPIKNIEFASDLSGIATNTQVMHLLFQSLLDAYAPLPGERKYFRLNIGEDPARDNDETNMKDYEDLGSMDDLKMREKIRKLTEQYVDAPGQKEIIDICSDILKE